MSNESFENILKSNENYQEYEYKLKQPYSIKLEQKEWAKIKKENISQGYEYYVNKYPNGIYIEEAKKLYYETLESETWKNRKKENTLRAYKEYLEKYPNGLHAKKAHMNIEFIEWKIQNIENRLEGKTGLKKIIAYIILLGMAWPIWFGISVVTSGVYGTKDIFYTITLGFEYFVSYKIVLYLLNFSYIEQKKLLLFFKKPIKLFFLLLTVHVIYAVLVIFYDINSKIIPEAIYISSSIVIIYYIWFLIYLHLLYYLKNKLYVWHLL